MFSLPVGLGVNCRSPRGSEEHQIAVDSTRSAQIATVCFAIAMATLNANTATTEPYNGPFELLSILQRVFPSVNSFEIVKTIVQGNANGYIVKLVSSSSSSSSPLHPDQVFVKQVMASQYLNTKKDWPDLRRTLCYARTEVRFYGRLLPLLRDKLQETSARGGRMIGTPRVYLATYNLQDWIQEDEPTSASTSTVNPNWDLHKLPHAPERGGALVLECVSNDLYYQDSPLSLDECRQCLAAVAQLHAAAWQDETLLQTIDRDLSKASFHLSGRNPKELAGIVDSWQGFVQAFRDDMQACNLWERPQIRDDLGRRIARCAEYVSQQVSPQPHDPYATLIHGDYKSMNVFLPRREKIPEAAVATEPTTTTATTATTATGHGNGAILVDFAAVGLGLGASDLALHIHHAVRPELLDNGGEEALLRYYWETLHELLRSSNSLPQVSQEEPNVNQDETTTTTTELYPWSVFLRHYRLAVVDYGRFIMALMWKNATLETMAKKKDNPNVTLINRDPKAAMAFIQRVDHYLTELEQTEGSLFL